MRLITYSLGTTINYGHEYACYRELFNHSNNRLLDLFKNHGASGRSACFLPKHWATIVHDIMKKMLNVDPNLKFYRIYEKYGRLTIEVTSSSIDEDTLTQLSDLKHEAQNRLDAITHSLIYRKFNNLTKGDRKWLLSKGRIKTKV